MIEELIFGPPILLIVLGMILYIRHRRGGSIDPACRIAIWCLAGGFVLASRPCSHLLSFPLRHWVQSSDFSGRADAIVVPGAGATSVGAPTSGSATRAFLGASAYLEGRGPLVLFTGYSPEDSLGAAKAMRIIARGMGVPDSCILMCSGYTTYSEAVLGKNLLVSRNVRKILLVTTWYHVPRATAVWRKLGFEVMPITVFPRRYRWVSWDNWKRIRAFCHEYAGLLFYKLEGWI